MIERFKEPRPQLHHPLDRPLAQAQRRPDPHQIFEHVFETGRREGEHLGRRIERRRQRTNTPFVDRADRTHPLRDDQIGAELPQPGLVEAVQVFAGRLGGPHRLVDLARRARRDGRFGEDGQLPNSERFIALVAAPDESFGRAQFGDHLGARGQQTDDVLRTPGFVDEHTHSRMLGPANPKPGALGTHESPFMTRTAPIVACSQLPRSLIAVVSVLLLLVCPLAISSADAQTPEERRQQRIDAARQAQQQRAQQNQQQNPVPPAVRGNNADQEPLAAPADIGALAGEEGLISLNFDEPIQITSLLEIVSTELGINIIADPAVLGRTVLFRAPVEITVDELLPFVESILDNEGFTLQRDRLGHYTVKPSPQAPLRFDDDTTRIYSSPLITPSRLQQSITTALGQNNPQVNNIRFGPLDEVGLLVVTASRPTLATVEQLMERILEALDERVPHRFPVVNVAAPVARDRVLELHADLVGGAIPGQVQVNPQVVRPGVNPQSAARGNAGNSELAERLFVDSRGNALRFIGTPEEATLIADLVAEADLVTPLIAKRYIAGQVMPDILQAAERLGLGSAETIQGATGSVFGNRGGAANNQQTGGFFGSGFQVDDEQGTFVYFGTPAQHERVDELVEEFRADAYSQDRTIEIYKLRYARAAPGTESDEGEGAEAVGIVDLLQQLIERPDTVETAQGRLLPESPEERAQAVLEGALGPEVAAAADATRLIATEDNTTIVADEDRNQIIIYAPPAAQRQFAKLIDQLDQRRAQVQIEVTIISIGRTDEFDFSTEFGFDLGFNGGSVQLFSGSQQDFDTFNVPAAGGTIAGGDNGLSIGMLDTELFRFGLRAIEGDSRTKIISAPSLVVTDNGEATLESTAEVPFSSTSQGDGATVTSQGGTAEAGTTLEIRPRIGAGGDIVLDYRLELSSFTGAAAGGLQPPAAREIYESEVILPSGTTLVVGGLKSVDEEDVNSGIPLFKDFPILGPLFADTSTSTSLNTIYVFITPRVLRDPNALDLSLITEYALQEVQLEGNWPSLDPVTIPIAPYRPLDERLLPENRLRDR